MMQLPLSVPTVGDDVELNMLGSASISNVCGTIGRKTEEMSLYIAVETMIQTLQ